MLTQKWALAFFSSLLAFAILQTCLFGTKALPATILIVHEVLDQKSLPTQAEMLKLCNSIESNHCAARSAKRILAANPNHLSALGSLAVSMCRLGECDHAGNYFLSYFGEGGSAKDVMYWYGRYFKEKGDLDAAKKWFQQANSASASSSEAAWR